MDGLEHLLAVVLVAQSLGVLLLEQEDQGVAADVTQDVFFQTMMQDSRLNDAVLAYFVAGKDALPNTETYTSLIYVCVKLRRLDQGFAMFEEMMERSIIPDNRTYAHLIKGCGRTRQIRRGEASSGCSRSGTRRACSTRASSTP